MSKRVVLGNGPPLRTLGRRLVDRSAAVHVVTPSESDGENARETGARVTVGDPTDRNVLADIAPVDSVVVATPDPDLATGLVRAVRDVYPSVPVVAYLETTGGDDARWETVAALADRVFDPGEETADYLLERVTGKGVRMRQLRQVLRGIDRLAVVTHDNPDPDAIASAVALKRIATASGCEVGLYYYGTISHQENQALVNLLEFDLTTLAPGEEPEADGVALVDHSRPGVNDGLPEETEVDVVVDHHPPRGPVEARFVDLRSDAGATSTLLVDYFDHFGVTPETDVATGLLFGIRTDTREFTRGVAAMDFEAAAWLLPEADLGTLDRIESPSVSPETFDTIAAAITERRREGDLLLSCVGRLSNHDALAQAADRLVGIEDVSTAVVYGILDGTIHVSARSRDPDLDLGQVLRDAFGRIGSAGGHAEMAGAQITLGVLESVDDRDESLTDVVEAFVSSRVLEAVESDRGLPLAKGAGGTGGDQYLLTGGGGPESGGDPADEEDA